MSTPLDWTAARELAQRCPILVQDARAWALDCEWLDADVIIGISDESVLMGADRHYDGGLVQLAHDTADTAALAALGVDA